jgi:esterase
MKLLNYTYLENNTKPTLVILHGLLGSSDNWRTVANKLLLNFNIYCFDLRNHGASFHADSMSYKDMATDVIYSMDYLSINPEYIIGHSMGGKTVMRLLQEYSGFSKAIIVDIAPVKYSTHHEDVLNALKYVKFDGLISRGDLDAVLETYVSSIATRQLLMKNIARNETGVFKWKCNHLAIVNYYAEIMDLSHLNTVIDTKTLFIRGGQSDYINSDYLSHITALFSDVKINTIEKAGHWVQVQAPELFIQECLGFFK